MRWVSVLTPRPLNCEKHASKNARFLRKKRQFSGPDPSSLERGAEALTPERTRRVSALTCQCVDPATVGLPPTSCVADGLRAPRAGAPQRPAFGRSGGATP